MKEDIEGNSGPSLVALLIATPANTQRDRHVIANT